MENSKTLLLANFKDPVTGEPLATSPHTKKLRLADQRLTLIIETTAQNQPLYAALKTAIAKALEKSQITLDLILTPPANQAANKQANPQPNKFNTKGIKHIVAVASGKGGVGKSTIAANLAVALAQQGLNSGLLDADIYGPSVPKIMGLENKQPQMKGDILDPLIAHRVKCLSVGFLVKDSRMPLIWRGPMIIKALEQLIHRANWAPLDILVIDMPPGTGDAPLTLAARTPLSGAIVVTTPQQVALVDVVKAMAMFERLEVPLIGMVENMAEFRCDECGKTHRLFGDDKALRAELKSRNLPLLASLPFTADIRTHSDCGTPNPPPPFKDIATNLTTHLKLDTQ